MSERDTHAHNAAGDTVLRVAERIDIAIELGSNAQRGAVIRDALAELASALDRLSPTECRGVVAALRRAASFVNRPDPV